MTKSKKQGGGGVKKYQVGYETGGGLSFFDEKPLSEAGGKPLMPTNCVGKKRNTNTFQRKPVPPNQGAAG